MSGAARHDWAPALVCDGLGFPEGPIWMRDGSVVVVEIRAKRVSSIASDGGRSTIAELAGGPNGAALGPGGAIYVCNNGGMAFVDLADGGSLPVGVAADYVGGSIQRVDPATGAVESLYTHCDGQPLNSPNDLVFDRAGGFWFTDLGRTMPTGHDPGHVYYAAADGSAIRRVRSGMHSPNGIGLTADGGTLFVAETITSRVWKHRVTAPGRIAASDDIWLPGGVLGPLPGYQLLDSLAVDEADHVCVGTLVNGGITDFAPDGTSVHLPVPDRAVTNLCFGGEDRRDVWITASATGKLYRARWPRAGVRLAYQR